MPLEEIDLSTFVGREDALASVLAEMKKSGPLCLHDTEGVSGIGKTAFLRKLNDERASDTGVFAVGLSMRNYEPGPVLETEGDPVRDNLVNEQMNWDKYRRLLVDLANSLPQEEFSDFKEKVDSVCDSVLAEVIEDFIPHGQSIKIEGIRLAPLSKIESGANIKLGSVNIHLPDSAIGLSMGKAREAVTQEFVKRLNLVSTSKRFAIFVDDYDRVLKRDLGHWFLTELVPNLSNSVVVLTRIESEDVLDGSYPILPFSLGNLNLADVEAYLERKFKVSALPAGVADRIYEFSGGHPRIVALAASIIEHRGLDDPDLLQVFNDMPEEEAPRFEAMVEALMDSISEDLREALRTVSVVRRFDADLLKALCEPSPEARQCGDLIKRLREYSFIERFRSASGVCEFCRLHEFIRRILSNQLAPSRQQELHRLAADYYGTKAKACEDERKPGEASSYQRAYRYEDPEWQDMIAEWLYHLGHLTDRTHAGVMFARIYFDAFWWWGCYLPWGFCERILVDWERSQPLAEDLQWLRLLRDFHRAYPTGYEKHGKGDWATVERSLFSLRLRGGLLSDPGKIKPEQRHLRAITDIFLAESYRYRKAEDPRAEEWYLDALKLIELGEDDDDSWNRPWTLWHLADMYLDRKEYDKALARTQESLDAAQDSNIDSQDRDCEVISNNYRVRADILWQQGKIPEAFGEYARAVYFAYLFQAIPKSPPDYYTREFYREMRDRTAARLMQLRAEGKDAAAKQGCQTLQDFWAPYWESVGRPSNDKDMIMAAASPEELKSALFPPEPGDDDMKPSSGYADDLQFNIASIKLE